MNVLLVILDSVRARNTSLHGHHNETTPFLDTFAEQATVFKQARSPGTWSLPSHASLFTRFHVEEHGLASPTDILEPGHTVFEDLREAGYDTGVFSENPFITVSDSGLDRGFDTVEGPRNVPFRDALDPTEFVQREGQGQFRAYLQACLDHDRPIRSIANGALVKLAWDYPQLLPSRFSPTTSADVYVDLFLDWVKRVGRPWAACVNLMDAHLPYQPESGHNRWSDDVLEQLQNSMDDQVWEFVGGKRPWWQREALEALYDGTIHQMDAQLRRLVEELDNQGELDETLVVITSDHGECFGEYSHVQPARLAGHGPGIAEPLIHVPLVVREPGQERARRVSAPVSLTHFPATVAAALDGDDPTRPLVDGDTLVSYHGLPESAKIRAREYASEEALDTLDGRSRAAYVDHGPGVRKHVAWRDRTRTVQVVDPRTSYAVAETDGTPDPSRDLDDAFEGITDTGIKQRGDEDIDDATRRHLEDLGYV
ncbi:sulfatase [Halobellus ordinarius]|uniref:sulfatase n=1 Tax=Halobellus ordinarius TaxID=3075120 RepID=UPI0028802E2A|nr:sulfatase [Halobellus sp. ZY16]